MRLWSLHPRYLDPQGLVALWREALLARAVLEGRTRGYCLHPQLQRFRQAADPLAAIRAYLLYVREEAQRRGYSFRALDGPSLVGQTLTVTTGQLWHELAHLRRKLESRSPDWARLLPHSLPDPHPLFTVVPGDVEPWERSLTLYKGERAR